MDNVGVNYIRETLCRSFDLPKGSGYNVISPMLVSEQEKMQRESHFFLECIRFYNLPENSTWEDISNAYYRDIQNSISNLSSIADKKAFIRSELRRFQLAKLVQLNKFTVSPREILQNFLVLGINIES